MTKQSLFSPLQRDIFEIDATGVSFGRLASMIALRLMGKHKPSYRPHVDGGDIVRVKNVSRMRLSGNKRTQKNYYHHTGYAGALKIIPLERVFSKAPEKVLRSAVSNMLPRNLHKPRRLKRLQFIKE